MKRVALTTLLVALTASLWAFDIPKPTAEITRFQVEAISLRDVTFLFDLSVKNPYPIKIGFDGVTLVFAVEGTQVFTTSSKGGFSVGAKSEKTNTFTVTLAYDAIIKLVKDYISKEWLNTVINGTLVIPLPRMPGLPKNVTFTYELSKKIPAIKPKVEVLNFAVRPPSADQVKAALIRAGKKTDPGKALGVFKDVLAGRKPAAPVIDPADLDVPLTVQFTIAIKNEAKGPLAFNSLHYNLIVNEEHLVAGDATEVVRNADGDLVTVTNVFSSSKMSKRVKQLFSDRRGTFGIQGKASLKLPDEIRKEPIPLSFDESGSFSMR
ncbi:MAG: LEA type 2 family protein [Spirochaetia bacterium]|jgi:LEA14-like dessication related protein